MDNKIFTIYNTIYGVESPDDMVVILNSLIIEVGMHHQGKLKSPDSTCLYPSPRPVRADPDQLNRRFISKAQRTLGAVSDTVREVVNLVNTLPDPNGHP